MPVPARFVTTITTFLLMTAISVRSAAGQGSGLRSLPDSREAEAAKGRTTLFSGPVDQRSEFGKAWFPEPLRASEMDLEFSEIRLDWFHGEQHGHYQDEVKVELEKAFGS